MHKKILILGKGYIGNSVYEYITDNTSHKVEIKSKKELDYSDSKILTAYLKAHNIEYVVGAFGYTGVPNVDACEDNKELCVELNKTQLVNVANTCINAKIKFGYISSGCIYNRKNNPKIDWFTETDEPNFGMNNPEASFYSKTKHDAENAISKLPIHVWRIRMPFDNTNKSKNYLYKIYKYNTLLDNEYNSLSYIPDVCNVICKSIEGNVPVGIYNVVNTGAVNVRDVTKIMEGYNIKNPNWKYLSYDQLKQEGLIKANRSNCVLSNDKIKKYVDVQGVFGALSYAISELKDNV